MFTEPSSILSFPPSILRRVNLRHPSLQSSQSGLSLKYQQSMPSVRHLATHPSHFLFVEAEAQRFSSLSFSPHSSNRMVPPPPTMQFPLHLQAIFEDSELVTIVVDNAKSHISEDQGVKRRNSEPSSSSPRRNHRRSLKRTRSDPPKPFSRWESETKPSQTNCMAPAKVEPSVRGTTSLQNVLSKPVRRQSIEDADLLAQLHDSLSSLEGAIDENQSTAEILARALESLDLYDDDF